MPYAVITTWELSDGADWHVFLDNMKEHRVPALKDLGATRVTVFRTSERTFAALTEWPDEQTVTTAMMAIDLIRKQVHTDGSRMTGEIKGQMVLQE